MTENRLLSFLNDASREDLINLPRIGPAIAEKLIATRPLENLEEAEKIRGISANLLEKLTTALPEDVEVVDEEEEEKVDKEAIAAITASSSRISEISEDAKESLADLKEKATQQGEATREAIESIPERFEEASEKRGVFWSSLLNGALIALISIFLTLAVLAGINGSLKFSTSSDAKTMQREADQLVEQANTLQGELDGVRNRVDTLEGLGERTIALEKAQEALKDGLAAANQQVENMQSDIDALNQRINEQNEMIAQQAESIQSFDNFFENLGILLNETFNPQSEEIEEVPIEEGEEESEGESE